MDVSRLIHSEPSPEASLKRRASSTFASDDFEEGSSRKRRRESDVDAGAAESAPEDETQPRVDGDALADELEMELQCGCCSALVYRPVVVSPCQHFFCGSCIVLWVKNGGTNCPACRGVANSVNPSRALQTMADVLVRHAPSKARTANERMQADEVYKPNITFLKIPTPRQASPEPSIPQSNLNFVHPCPHCHPGNEWGWVCPQPIPNPDTDPESAWHSDDGAPPGHAYCGNCESVLALRAPSTTKCDFCQVSFCGIGIPGRCVAAPLLSQHLHGLSDLGDLIQCGEVYDIFDGNTVEVDIMFDYLTTQHLSPRHIYREVIAMITSSPRGFTPLIESDLFMDVHPVAAGVDPDPSAPRNRICRMCATEVLLWGLKEWWVHERKKGFLEGHILKRPDCPDGALCQRQRDHAHAKDFNHIIGPAAAGGQAEGHPVGNTPPRNDDHPERALPTAGGSGVGHPPAPETIPTRFADPPADRRGPSEAEYHEMLKDLPTMSTQPNHLPSVEGLASSSSSFEVQAELDAVFDRS